MNLNSVFSKISEKFVKYDNIGKILHQDNSIFDIKVSMKSLKS